MYAVIETGGKQYRVEEGQFLNVERLAAEQGQVIEFEKVLMTADGEVVNLGAPYLNGGRVKAEILTHCRGEKIHIIKFRRRKHHMKRQGHRQDLTTIKITAIEV